MTGRRRKGKRLAAADGFEVAEGAGSEVVGAAEGDGGVGHLGEHVGEAFAGEADELCTFGAVGEGTGVEAAGAVDGVDHLVCFQFGGNYYDDEEERRNSVTVFPGCDMRKTITSKLPLENGKIYNFKVTI